MANTVLQSLSPFGTNGFLTTAFEHSYNVTTLLEQDTELVPRGAIILDIHECEEMARSGTIPVSTKLVYLPIIGNFWFDINDDINSTLSEEWCPARGSDLFASFVEEDVSSLRNMSNYAKEPFATVNGEPMEILWTFSEDPFYYSACPIEPDKVVCDDCDVVSQPPEGCDAFAGMDVCPCSTWWAADETEWKSGETRIYNFGATIMDENGTAYCLEATYTLTAQESNSTSEESNSTSEDVEFTTVTAYEILPDEFAPDHYSEAPRMVWAHSVVFAFGLFQTFRSFW